MASKFSRYLPYSGGKTPEKNLNQEYWPDRGSNPAVVDMYKTASRIICAIDADLMEIDRQWIAQELLFFLFHKHAV